MKQHRKARVALSLATVAALGVAAAAPQARADSGTDVERRELFQAELFAAWDSCTDGPPAGATCSVTTVVAVLAEGTEFGDDTTSFMDVNHTRYEATTSGDWERQERWFGIGPAEIALDRRLGSASASALVEVEHCELGSLECPDRPPRAIEVDWDGLGEVTTSSDRAVLHAGIRFHAGHGSGMERDAAAVGGLDGADLGISVDGAMRTWRARGISMTREAAIAGLGRIEFPYGILGGDTELSAAWSTCGEVRSPGDECTITVVTAYDPPYWDDSTATPGMIVTRNRFRLAHNGELLQVGFELGESGDAHLSTARPARTAAAQADVAFEECTSSAPPADDGPPPPPGTSPAVECHDVVRAVSVAWSASGKPMRTHSIRVDRHGQTTEATREAFDWYPAEAIGTMEGDDLGESVWAVIGVRRAPR